MLRQPAMLRRRFGRGHDGEKIIAMPRRIERFKPAIATSPLALYAWAASATGKTMQTPSSQASRLADWRKEVTDPVDGRSRSIFRGCWHGHAGYSLRHECRNSGPPMVADMRAVENGIGQRLRLPARREMFGKAFRTPLSAPYRTHREWRSCAQRHVCAACRTHAVNGSDAILRRFKRGLAANWAGALTQEKE